jgi:putative ABC transport system permease protein
MAGTLVGAAVADQTSLLYTATIVPLLADTLRDLRRRRLRSALTVLGVAIGAAALVLLGALAEKVSHLVAGGRDFAAAQITVSGAGSGGMIGLMRGALVSHEQLRALAGIPGVRLAAPLVMFPVADSPSTMPFTLAPHVFGIDAVALQANRTSVALHAADGATTPGGPDEVVVGNEVARFFHVGTGDTLTVRGQGFRVVGVLEPTLTGPDSFVFMQFPTAQRLLLDSDPVLRRLALVPGATILPIATAAAVFWDDGADPEAVADRIRERVENVTVLSPGDAERQIDRAMAVMNGLIVGSGLVALVVASLAVANTLLTAVVERRREIGLRRVVGATRGQVIVQLVVEAALLGLAGGVAGLIAGALAVGGLNGLTERLGAPVFLLTPRLACAAVLFPALLAALAGAWPARRAARLAPVEAIRYG